MRTMAFSALIVLVILASATTLISKGADLGPKEPVIIAFGWFGFLLLSALLTFLRFRRVKYGIEERAVVANGRATMPERRTLQPQETPSASAVVEEKSSASVAGESEAEEPETEQEPRLLKAVVRKVASGIKEARARPKKRGVEELEEPETEESSS